MTQETDKRYEEEKAKTRECIDGLHSLLGHATYSTRRQLIAFLRQEADAIETEADTDKALSSL